MRKTISLLFWMTRAWSYTSSVLSGDPRQNDSSIDLPLILIIETIDANEINVRENLSEFVSVFTDLYAFPRIANDTIRFAGSNELFYETTFDLYFGEESLLGGSSGD